MAQRHFRAIRFTSGYLSGIDAYLETTVSGFRIATFTTDGERLTHSTPSCEYTPTGEPFTIDDATPVWRALNARSQS